MLETLQNTPKAQPYSRLPAHAAARSLRQAQQAAGVGQRVLLVDASLAHTQAVFTPPTNIIINMHAHPDNTHFLNSTPKFSRAPTHAAAHSSRQA